MESGGKERNKKIVLVICQECSTFILKLWGTGEGFWARDMMPAGLWKVGEEVTYRASLLEWSYMRVGTMQRVDVPSAWHMLSEAQEEGKRALVTVYTPAFSLGLQSCAS